MTSTDYEILGKTILLFWDEKNNFDNALTKRKIGIDLFQDVKLIERLEVFKTTISDADDEQNFLFLVHLHHSENNKGYDTFKNSSITRYFPGLRFHLISSAPKREIYEQDGNSTLDVYSYDNYHDKIANTFAPQTKLQIITNSSLLVDNKLTTTKQGIFLSHTSKDREVVEKFRDIILNSGLNFDLAKIKFTSEENHGIAGGINIPEDLRTFLKDETGLFIQFVSPDYLISRVCLNEEGAAWCLMDELMFLPILLPPASSKDIAWVKVVNKGIKISNRDSLLNLYQDRKAFFGDINVTHFNKKVEEFLEYIAASGYSKA
ncbi:hypothetical protein PBAL39_15764 [Pedobacter sp. BAL39]|uniref:toll/interleukin-1 receptor domain-containing protein n=1 Tax=Pedobacter sp. BAL39 TaxID=391596 RepID=UPI0001559FE3|nr:toll/interleukin-1 receptor domain-containing protein [Pedobacter sp. BAL39]EDM37896.1 hypothetical protein PBAL39_15764 [Pedobacter sp. BAL39]